MIEIIKYVPINKNKIIGYVDISIPAIQMPKTILRHIAHLQNGEKSWFNLPSFPQEKADGKMEYLRYWEFEHQAYNKQIMQAIEREVKKYLINSLNSTPTDDSTNPADYLSKSDDLPF